MPSSTTAVPFFALPERQDGPARLNHLLDSLGLSATLLRAVPLPPAILAETLVVAETDETGRAHRLAPAAASAWQAMKAAAAGDGVVLTIVSAFRSLEDQADIIREKAAQGMPLGEILKRSAAPGYSEHHSGNAVDINTPGCAEREEPFESTAAFGWLCRHAEAFGFHLSYPRNNRWGFLYEPWHWFFQGIGQGAKSCA